MYGGSNLPAAGGGALGASLAMTGVGGVPLYVALGLVSLLAGLLLLRSSYMRRKQS